MQARLAEEKRATSGTRTRDPRITNALLYQLSHIGITRFLSAFVDTGDDLAQTWTDILSYAF